MDLPFCLNDLLKFGDGDSDVLPDGASHEVSPKLPNAMRIFQAKEVIKNKLC